MPPLGPRHPDVRRLHDLLRRPGDRAAVRACVVEGPLLAGEAVAAGLDVRAVYVGADALADPDPAVAACLDTCAAAGVAVVALAPGVAERVATTTTPRPVLALVGLAEPAPGVLAAATFAVVLVDVADPGNVGTVARSAAAAGADVLVVAGPAAADPTGPKALRASAGALLRLPVLRRPHGGAALAEVGEAGLVRVGGVARDGRAPDAVDLTIAVALVVGGEARGLGEPERAELDVACTIPMAAGTESLNAAMAATVLCFEVARQRRARPTP